MILKMNDGFELIHDIFRLRWIPEIIGAIGDENHSYSNISDGIKIISNTELNRKLAILQERDVIIKKEMDGREGYYLTPFGLDIEHIFKHFSEMSDKYINKSYTES